MSEKSGTQKPRKNKALVFFLVLIGCVVFVAIAVAIFLGVTGMEKDELEAKMREYSDSIALKISPNKPIDVAESNQDVSGVSREADNADGDQQNSEEEEAEVTAEVDNTPQPPPESQEHSLNISSQQLDVSITLTDIEMTEKLLIATFRITNNSKYTVYFPFYGTNASYDDNGGSMYRDLDSEKDADYDQIPTVISSGETATGRIAYTPLIYYDKPFTIYISGLKFREVEEEWESFEFYFDPTDQR